MSSPFWWGDWRPNLTPHTGNLQPTDLIECTSISLLGVPTNTAITGAQIIAAASGGSATWGGITGTLSAQTDLQTALNGKQDTLVSGTNIKTVNGNSLLGSGDIAIQPNPRLLAFSGKNGTQTSGTTITISYSVLIPANTFTNNNILQVVFRMLRQSGSVGQIYGRIYFNTANTLTGATLFNTIFTMNNGSNTGYVERNFGYNGTNLVSFANPAFSDYTTGAVVNVAFNATVDNYILLTMQVQNIADVANINLFKVFAYV